MYSFFSKYKVWKGRPIQTSFHKTNLLIFHPRWQIWWWKSTKWWSWLVKRLSGNVLHSLSLVVMLIPQGKQITTTTTTTTIVFFFLKSKNSNKNYISSSCGFGGLKIKIQFFRVIRRVSWVPENLDLSFLFFGLKQLLRCLTRNKKNNFSFKVLISTRNRILERNLLSRNGQSSKLRNF